MGTEPSGFSRWLRARSCRARPTSPTVGTRRFARPLRSALVDNHKRGRERKSDRRHGFLFFLIGLLVALLAAPVCELLGEPVRGESERGIESTAREANAKIVSDQYVGPSG